MVARMKVGLRRGIAYLAQRVISEKDLSAIYDYDSGSYYQFSGDVSRARVNIYDYDRSCFLGGDPPSLYDYGEGNFFEFKIEGNRVNGYDYESGSFFEATVSDRNVSVYDYEVGAFFNYSV